jgi:hypothetical protein
MAGESESPNQSIKSFTCQNCGAPIELRAQELTLSVACSGCGSISEKELGVFKFIKVAHDFQASKLLVPLGAKGQLRGQTYQVIGFMERYDSHYTLQPWGEYLLFNPYIGFHWLAESKGHWTLYKPLKSIPKKSGQKKYKLLGETYNLYNKGDVVVGYVLGEFYWKVRVGDTVQAVDAICPPYIISSETSEDEVLWSIGDYIQSTDVAKAFQVNYLPAPSGIAPNQPANHFHTKEMWLSWFVALLLMSFVHHFGKAMRPETLIDSQRISVPATGLTDSQLAHFSVKEFSNHMTVLLESSLNQSWSSIHLRVVPMDSSNTNSYSFEKDMSYYSGSDSDGSWSEGSQDAEMLVNTLPSGAYSVLLTASPEPGKNFELHAIVTLFPKIWSNFWLVFFLISLPPFWVLFRSRSFEQRRWADSDFNPFDQENKNKDNE